MNVSKWNDEYSTWILYNYLNLGILQTNFMTSSQLPAGNLNWLEHCTGISDQC